MAEVGSAFVSIVPSTRGFANKLSSQISGPAGTAGTAAGVKMGTGLKSGMGSGLKGIGALLAGSFIVKKGISFFSDAVKGASDLSESANKVNVVFGKQAGIITQTSKTSATAMGLSKQAYLESAGTLGNLLVSLEVAPKKAATMSASMVKLAGDLASFNNTSPEEALLALRSGLTGETEPLKRYGINMNEATLKTQALKMGLISSVKEALTPQAKALAAQALIMKQTGTAQGDFARTSGGLANQQRIAAASMDNLKAKIGTALLPAVTAGVVGFTAFITAIQSGTATGHGFAGFMSELGVRVKELGGFITGTVVPALQSFGSFLSANKGAILGVVTVLVAIKVAMLAYAATQAVIAGLGAVAHFVQLARAVGIARAVQLQFNAALFANPIGLVILAVAALVAGFIIAYRQSATFRNIVQGALRAVATAFGAVTAAASAVFGWIKSHWPLLLGLLAGPFGLALVLIAKHWHSIETAVSSSISTVMGYVRAIPGKITAALGNMGTLLLGAGKAVISGLVSGITSQFGTIGDAMGQVGGFIKSHLPNSPAAKKGPLAGVHFEDIGKNMMGDLAAGLAKGGQKTLDAIGSIADGVKTKLQGLRTDAAGIMSSVGDAIRGVLDVSAIGAPIETITKVMTDVGSAAQNLYDSTGLFLSRVEAVAPTYEDVSTFRTPSPKETVQGFAAQAVAFAAALAAMAKKGIAPALIAAVAAAGPAQGMTAANALNSMSDADVTLTRTAMGQIATAAKAAGSTVLSTTRIPGDIKREEDTLATLRDIKQQLGKDIDPQVVVKGDDLWIVFKRVEKKQARRG